MSRSVAVVGAGLAGLACALRLARAGRRVTLLERSSSLGGRARTRIRSGFHLNLGPHALYRAGAARRVLDDLGIPIRGASPPLAALALCAGEAPVRLPFDPVGALTTPLLTAAERWEATRFVGSLAVARPEALRGRTVSDWLGPLSPAVGSIAHALVRVATYTHAPDAMDAGAAVAQVQRAMRGVDYLDGGWIQLVDALVERAVAAGVEIRAGAAVRSVDELDADEVVLCVGPGVAAALTGSDALNAVARAATPVRAACLDVMLDVETDPARRFGLGVDRPLYVAVHSDVAALAPRGGTLIQAAIYGGDGSRDELEVALDALHPGWRAHVVAARWLPELIVAHDLPRIGGRRAPHAVPDRPGVWVAGDWVGEEGMLSDAALASADAVARAILAREREAA